MVSTSVTEADPGLSTGTSNVIALIVLCPPGIFCDTHGRMSDFPAKFPVLNIDTEPFKNAIDVSQKNLMNCRGTVWPCTCIWKRFHYQCP